jgi:hypothetical protein
MAADPRWGRKTRGEGRWIAATLVAFVAGAAWIALLLAFMYPRLLFDLGLITEDQLRAAEAQAVAVPPEEHQIDDPNR